MEPTSQPPSEPTPEPTAPCEPEAPLKPMSAAIKGGISFGVFSAFLFAYGGVIPWITGIASIALPWFIFRHQSRRIMGVACAVVAAGIFYIPIDGIFNFDRENRDRRKNQPTSQPAKQTTGPHQSDSEASWRAFCIIGAHCEEILPPTLMNAGSSSRMRIISESPCFLASTTRAKGISRRGLSSLEIQ